jgi:hypothetical protein
VPADDFARFQHGNALLADGERRLRRHADGDESAETGDIEQLLYLGWRFQRGINTLGPGPREPLPHFDLTTTDHGRVRWEDFTGRKLFITFGSIT